MGRLAARTDRTQRAIVDRLRREGASVCSLHRVGHGVPDLLVGIRGETHLAEVKDGARAPSRRTLTPDQVRFIEGWRGSPVVVLASPDEAAAWVRRLGRR